MEIRFCYHEIWNFKVYFREKSGDSWLASTKSRNLRSIVVKNLEINSNLLKIWKFQIHFQEKTGNLGSVSMYLRSISIKNLETHG